MFDCGHAHHSFEVAFHLECRYPSKEKLQRIIALCSRNLAISTILDTSRVIANTWMQFVCIPIAANHVNMSSVKV